MAEEREQPEVLVLTAELMIEGHLYQGARDAGAKWVGWRIRKIDGERAGNVYLARLWSDGRLQCECDDHKCRKRVCKHLLAVLPLLLAEGRQLPAIAATPTPKAG